MLFVNVPLVIAWFMLYNASSTIEVFIAFSLLGLGVGLMESPVITYIGEIWYVMRFCIHSSFPVLQDLKQPIYMTEIHIKTIEFIISVSPGIAV